MGGANRIAAFLWFNKDVGDVFSMRELREALGEAGEMESAEHLNRRLRDLRAQGWAFDSYKSREGQSVDEYTLRAKGVRMWAGERLRSSTISNAMRRQVLDRDGNRCVICGVGAGEPYPDTPGSHARMTIGHRVANARLGDASLDNLQTECSRCNETVGDTVPNPESAEEVLAVALKLKAAERRELRDWIQLGYRQRSSLDLVFDRVRRLSESGKRRVVAQLDQTLKND